MSWDILRCGSVASSLGQSSHAHSSWPGQTTAPRDLVALRGLPTYRMTANYSIDHIFNQCFEARYRTTAYAQSWSPVVDKSKLIATLFPDQASCIVWPLHTALNMESWMFRGRTVSGTVTRSVVTGQDYMHILCILSVSFILFSNRNRIFFGYFDPRNTLIFNQIHNIRGDLTEIC